MTLPCYYAIGGLNFKNGFVTSCPQQAQKMQDMSEEYLPSKIFNNEKFVAHRKELMNGQFSKGCDMCEHVEKSNAGQSMRQEIDADLEFYDANTGTTDLQGLKTVELRFSNSCNMACLHCSEVFSSGWMKALKNYEPTEQDFKDDLHQLTGRMHREYPNDDFKMQMSTKTALEIVDDLNKNCPNLERVDFAGGEVLYQKQFFPTLHRLSKHPNAANMKVMFHSNFNADFDPYELNDLLTRFGKANIMISVDAGPRIYPYFRDGSWQKLLSNLEQFKEVNGKHTELNLVCTTGTYQLMEIEDIFLNFLKLDCNFIGASITYTPPYLNPSVMMLKFRGHVLNDIENCRNSIFNILKIRQETKLESRLLRSWYVTEEIINGKRKVTDRWQDIESALDSLENIRNYILNYHASKKDYNTFLKYIEKSDKLFKQNFNDYVQNYKFIDGDIVRNVSKEQ